MLNILFISACLKGIFCHKTVISIPTWTREKSLPYQEIQQIALHNALTVH